MNTLRSDTPIRIFRIGRVFTQYRYYNGNWHYEKSHPVGTSLRKCYENYLQDGIAVSTLELAHDWVIGNDQLILAFRGTKDDMILYCLTHNLMLRSDYE